MEKRKRGGQPGNKNAVGNRGGGAPLGNRNAQKHGFYARDGVLNSKAQETGIMQAFYRQRRFKNMIERVYNGELTPDELCQMYWTMGEYQSDDEVVTEILKLHRPLHQLKE